MHPRGPFFAAILIAFLQVSSGRAQTATSSVNEVQCAPAVYRPAASFVSWDDDPVYSMRPPFHTAVGDDLYYVGDILRLTQKDFASIVREMNAGRSDIGRIIFDAREIIVEGPLSFSHAELVFRSDILTFGPQGRVSFTGPMDAAHTDRLEIVTRSLQFNNSMPYPFQFEIEKDSRRSVDITAAEVVQSGVTVPSGAAQNVLWANTLTGAYNLAPLEPAVFKTTVGDSASETLKKDIADNVAWPQYTVAKLLKFHNRDPYGEENLNLLRNRMAALAPVVEVIHSPGTITQFYRLNNRIAARVDQFGHRANYTPRVSLQQQITTTKAISTEFDDKQFFSNLRELIVEAYKKPSVDQSVVDGLAVSIKKGQEEQAESIVTMDKMENENRNHHTAFLQLQGQISSRQLEIARAKQEEIEKQKTSADIKRGFSVSTAVIGVAVSIVATPAAGAAVGAAGNLIGNLVYANSSGKVDLETVVAALSEAGKYYDTMDKTFKAWDSFKTSQATATAVLIEGKKVTVKDPTPDDKNHTREITKEEAAKDWGKNAKDLYSSFYDLYQTLKPQKPTPLDLTKKEDMDPQLMGYLAQLADVQAQEAKTLDTIQSVLGQQAIAIQEQQEELAQLRDLRDSKVVNDADYERWKMASLSLWQSEVGRVSDSVYTLNRAYFYATGRTISRTREIADYFDEIQASLMTGLYDPTMLAEDTTPEGIAQALGRQQLHIKSALEATTLSANEGWDDYAKTLARNPDHFRDVYEYRLSDPDPQKAGFLRALNAQIRLAIALKKQAPTLIPLPVPMDILPAPTAGPEWLTDMAITKIDFSQGANAVGPSGLKFILVHPGYGKLFRADGTCSVFDMRDPSTFAQRERTTPVGSIDPGWQMRAVDKIDTQGSSGYYAFYPLRTELLLMVQVTSNNWKAIPEIKYLQIGLEQLR